jgi:A/G-specific adenine glycosylase
VATPAGVPPGARGPILDWYATHGRDLAFRRTTDPYAVLVSEAMAQQTQAARAAARWERWMVRFPTVESLAAATPADALREWQGLGYDRRALALWRAARVIVDEHSGRVPGSVADLEALPGVGPYTARAVAAIAFGAPVGAVDVNVRRVLGRMVAAPDDRRLTRTEVQRIADQAVPPRHAAAWTHALMDIGATCCRPRRPRCDDCPARAWCRFAATGEATDGVTSGERKPTRRERFPATTRWLRGRILDRVRAAGDGEWIPLDGAIGEHAPDRVHAAARAMMADGVLDVRSDDGVIRARLPLA